MTRSNDAPTRKRSDAYFTASFEVARRLADGRGEEAVDVLRRELERTSDSGEIEGRRFLLCQIALCHAHVGDREKAQQVLEEMEEQLPQQTETALMLSEGYLHLVGNAERASHHAALALQWAEEHDEGSPEKVSRAQALIARAALAAKDLTGALGAWQAAPLPDWRVAIELLDAGVDAEKVRQTLAEALPRHEEHERRKGATAAAGSEQIRRMISWIEAGCPRLPSQSS